MWRRPTGPFLRQPAVMGAEPRDPVQEVAAPPDGVSAFVARILDQLTLSAWLPAALLTSCAALLVRFRIQGSVDLPAALAGLTDDPVRLLVLTVPVLILATLVVQAFSFEAIRTLEGYWRRRGPASALRTVMIRRHVRHKRALARRRDEAARRAFAIARETLRRDHPPNVVAALEAQAEDEDLPSLTPEEAETLAGMSWRSRCHAWDLARVDHLAAAQADYPLSSRVLPTKLGNVIRATEDGLRHAGQDVEGFALQHRGTVAERVRLQHDQFRSRLDMYCTLVFAGSALAAVTVALLVGRVAILPLMATTTVFVLLATTSYGAAIASARGYCAALREMDAAAARQTVTPGAS